MEREGLPDVIVYPQQPGEADDKPEVEGEQPAKKPNDDPENEFEDHIPVEIIAPDHKHSWCMKTVCWKRFSIIGIELIGLYGVILDIMIFSEREFITYNEIFYIIIAMHIIFSIYSIGTLPFAEFVYRKTESKPIYLIYLVYGALNLGIGVLSIFKKEELDLNNLSSSATLLLVSIYLHLLLALCCMVILVFYHIISVCYCKEPP